VYIAGGMNSSAAIGSICKFGNRSSTAFSTSFPSSRASGAPKQSESRCQKQDEDWACDRPQTFLLAQTASRLDWRLRAKRSRSVQPEWFDRQAAFLVTLHGLNRGSIAQNLRSPAAGLAHFSVGQMPAGIRENREWHFPIGYRFHADKQHNAEIHKLLSCQLFPSLMCCNQISNQVVSVCPDAAESGWRSAIVCSAVGQGDDALTSV